MLNAIALFFIILLFIRQNRLYEVKKQQETMIRDMEEVMSAYLLEMKEENEQFLQQFNTIETRRTERPPHSPTAAEDETEDPSSLQTPNLHRLRAANLYRNSLAASPLTKEEQDGEESGQEENFLLSQVIFLQKKGLTIEEIAKRLDKGKTEIELALKFQRNVE